MDVGLSPHFVPNSRSDHDVFPDPNRSIEEKGVTVGETDPDGRSRLLGKRVRSFRDSHSVLTGRSRREPGGEGRVRGGSGGGWGGVGGRRPEVRLVLSEETTVREGVTGGRTLDIEDPSPVFLRKPPLSTQNI